MIGSRIALPDRAARSRVEPPHLLRRLYLLAGVVTLESLLLARVPHATLLGPFAPFGISAFGVFLALGHPSLEAHREPLPFSRRLFAIHLAAIAAVCAGCLPEPSGSALGAAPIQTLVVQVLLVGAVALLALALSPLQAWAGALRSSGWLWLYSCVAGAAAVALRAPFERLWDLPFGSRGRILQVASFEAVYALLHRTLPGVETDPRQWVIGTPAFSVRITPHCSGMEGLGLVLVFTIGWLLYRRREIRLPRALLLIPGALASVWILNVLRIAAIVLIGDAGAPEIAMVGFHSQAGWIAFTLVAVSFSAATRRLAWVRRDLGEPAGAEEGTESPATAQYLIPLLAILAAGILSRAASGSFEGLYPLRFVAAALALWRYRAGLRRLDWRFGWPAPVVGAGVFLLWMALAWGTEGRAVSPLGSALAGLSPLARAAWIALRVAAAGITVPIAEELAFRGYLPRRLMSREFDTVAFARLTILPIVLSSAAFGLMHGQRWLAGTLAGLAYAALLRRRGRIGDAVLAHAVSNLLLAAEVLIRGDWGMW